MAISVDPPPRAAAMIEKLRLPFHLLSDPQGKLAAKPLEVWNPETDLPHPAVVLVGPGGEQVERRVGHDFAERVLGPELLDLVRPLGWPAIAPEPSAPASPEPSERAFPVEALLPYYRGANYATRALAGRVPEVEPEAERYGSQLRELIDAVQARGIA